LDALAYLLTAKGVKTSSDSGKTVAYEEVLQMNTSIVLENALSAHILEKLEGK